MPIVVVLFPLLGALIASICIVFKYHKFAEVVTSIFMVFSAVMSIALYINLPDSVSLQIISEWITLNQDTIYWAILYDPLSAIMFVVVTVVSAMVHIYSIGYMHKDPHRSRFFCYLSLFTFAMLILVSSNNFIQLFVGWEGVGLCSYLLIGFWFKKESANSASIKAFVVNRVGDFGYILAMAMIFKTFNSLNFDIVFEQVEIFSNEYIKFLGFQINKITIICMLLFMGAVGKSAQIGLHIWLPDAMEGPTPVSALIHAATMVTAGVFLVIRCSPLFEYSSFALSFMTVIGAITLVFAATVGLVQNDIKRVIAYSTCSQLGYMFLACGLSAYSASIYHLVTHAFFKALLFLSAGSVIHAIANEQNMKKMGSLYKKLPYTYAFVWIGSLALAGFPPFSGYFSKDLIIEYSYGVHTNIGMLGYVFGNLGALLTALYSWRLIYLTFHGANRNKRVGVDVTPHESPFVMLFPLAILALGAIFSGYMFHNIVEEQNFWEGAIFMKDKKNILDIAHHIPFWSKAIPIVLALAGVLCATYLYIYNVNLPKAIKNQMNRIYLFLYNKWYFDELYTCIIIMPSKKIGMFFWKALDVNIIDRFGPDGISNIVSFLSTKAKDVQTGKVIHYAFIMLLGLILLISWQLIYNYKVLL